MRLYPNGAGFFRINMYLVMKQLHQHIFIGIADAVTTGIVQFKTVPGMQQVFHMRQERGNADAAGNKYMMLGLRIEGK